MICCCSNIYKSCSPVNTCSDSVFELPHTGLTPAATYTFRTNFLASVIEIDLVAGSDGKVTLPTANFNENYEYIGALYDSENVKIPFTVDTIVYDCIAFTTKQFINVS